MSHALRLSFAAAFVWTLSVSVADASERGTLADRSAGANVFRSERRAAGRDEVRARRVTRRAQYAAPAERSPFDTPDTRPLRVSGNTLEAKTPAGHASGFVLPANRVALGAGGSDSLGRALPGSEQRARNWNEYLRDNGSKPVGSGGAYAPTQPYDAARGPHGTPNPYDPSVPQPETRTFFDNGAGTHCTATGGAGTSWSSCNIAW
ncbi:hypothetical protein G3N62_13185 [Burkholderia sp. Tr-20355]|uniref:hypothetical protein n=1 Tax=Burkholderia seminalis TaxID=488731 RepID=UPI000F5A3702|nr:hypothetical protein [Burkholderia seminalis]MBN3739510.1 hypothetical protein [Burkholderia sp. Tr-20355]RQS81044.1 hypothetical protein DF032_11595 [Burkholderia seminalis]